MTRVNFGTPLPRRTTRSTRRRTASVRPDLDYRLLDGATVGDRETFYVYDAANARIIAYQRADGAFVRQWLAPRTGTEAGLLDDVRRPSASPRWPTARRSRPSSRRLGRPRRPRVGRLESIHGDQPFGRVRLIEMVVESVRVHMLSSQHVVILKESERDRYLPIWIGPSEANAIAMRLQGLSAERPLTHDLMVSVVAALNSSISRVVVTHVTDGTFHARLYLETADGGEAEIDSRTSGRDRGRRCAPARPIYVDERVLDEAGVEPDAPDGRRARREAGRLPRVRELARRGPGGRREGPAERGAGA